MGDLSAEPSMEDILSSIKRIIAEEGDGAPTRQRRPQRSAATTVAPSHASADTADEVLELSEPMPLPKPESAMRAQPAPLYRPQSATATITTSPAATAPAAPAPTAAADPQPIMSQQAAAASRGALETLSKLMVKPEADSDGTLEGLVREMLRPMLRDWLDANLPGLVETMVAREIEKITNQQQ